MELDIVLYGCVLMSIQQEKSLVGGPSVPLRGGRDKRVEVVKKSDVGKNKEVKPAETRKPKFGTKVVEQ